MAEAKLSLASLTSQLLGGRAATKEACFVCGYQSETHQLMRCHTKKYAAYPDVPYYNILGTIDPAPSALPVNTLTNSVNACSLCVKTLYMQWLEHEKKAVPDNKRMYWMKRPVGCELKVPYSQQELDELCYDNEEIVVGGSSGLKRKYAESNGNGNGHGDSSLSGSPKANGSASGPKVILLTNEAKTLKIEENSDDEVICQSENQNQTAASASASGILALNHSTALGGPGPINYSTKNPLLLRDVNCYLCGLKGLRTEFKRILSKESNEDAVLFEKILTMRAHNKGCVYADGSTYLCSICFKQSGVGSEEKSPRGSSECSTSNGMGATMNLVQQLAQFISESSGSGNPLTVPAESSASTMDLPATPKSQSISIEERSPKVEVKIENCPQPNCVICDRSQAAKTVHTQPRNKVILENGFTTKLDFVNFSFFPALAALAPTQNLSTTVPVCEICYGNLKCQWDQHEEAVIKSASSKSSGKKYNKKERWLRTYFINEAKCGACGEDTEISELEPLRLGGTLVKRIPKILLKGLAFEGILAVCKTCLEQHRKDGQDRDKVQDQKADLETVKSELQNILKEANFSGSELASRIEGLLQML